MPKSSLPPTGSSILLLLLLELSWWWLLLLFISVLFINKSSIDVVMEVGVFMIELVDDSKDSMKSGMIGAADPSSSNTVDLSFCKIMY